MVHNDTGPSFMSMELMQIQHKWRWIRVWVHSSVAYSTALNTCNILTAMMLWVQPLSDHAWNKFIIKVILITKEWKRARKSSQRQGSDPTQHILSASMSSLPVSVNVVTPMSANHHSVECWCLSLFQKCFIHMCTTTAFTDARNMCSSTTTEH